MLPHFQVYLAGLSRSAESSTRCPTDSSHGTISSYQQSPLDGYKFDLSRFGRSSSARNIHAVTFRVRL
jgi:hypothetical protein